MNLQIEKVTHNNLQNYKYIRLKALKETPNAFGSTYAKESKWTDEEWEKRFHGNNSIILLAKIEGEIIGIIGIYWMEGNKNKAEIWGTFVEENFRRKGIARKLMETIEEEAKKQETKTVELGVIEGQSAAFNLYKSMGYAKVRDEHNRREDGTEFSSTYYEKNL